MPLGSNGLRDPTLRVRLLAEIASPTPDWESLYAASGSADNVRLLGFRTPQLQPLHRADPGRGRPAAWPASRRGDHRSGAGGPESGQCGVFHDAGSHGSSAAGPALGEPLLGRGIAGAARGVPAPDPAPACLRCIRALPRSLRPGRTPRGALAEAIRRLTSLPARNLRLRDRGAIRAGGFADLVVFDPARIADRATWTQPHQFAVGVEHVVVNGQLALREGRLTGARPGRFVRGPGWQGTASGTAQTPAMGEAGLPRAAG